MNTLYTGLDHVCLLVQDLDVSVAFYERTFGFLCIYRTVCPKTERNATAKRYAMLQLGTLRLEVIQRTEIPYDRRDRAGVIDHIGLATTDIERAYEIVRTSGARISVPLKYDPSLMGGYRAFCLYGPDGEQIHVYKFGPYPAKEDA